MSENKFRIALKDRSYFYNGVAFDFWLAVRNIGPNDLGLAEVEGIESIESVYPNSNEMTMANRCCSFRIIPERTFDRGKVIANVVVHLAKCFCRYIEDVEILPKSNGDEADEKLVDEAKEALKKRFPTLLAEPSETAKNPEADMSYDNNTKSDATPTESDNTTEPNEFKGYDTIAALHALANSLVSAERKCGVNLRCGIIEEINFYSDSTRIVVKGETDRAYIFINGIKFD